MNKHWLDKSALPIESITMSLREFLYNVRASRNLGFPPPSVDSAQAAAAPVKTIPVRSTKWLSPAIVDGFREDDFDFLEDVERQRLTNSIAEFSKIAKGVAAGTPASPEQIQIAAGALQRIIDIVRPKDFADEQALIIGRRIERELNGQLPEWAKGLRFATGEDSLDEPALWISIKVLEEGADDDALYAKYVSLRDALEPLARKHAADRWLYVALEGIDPGEEKA